MSIPLSHWVVFLIVSAFVAWLNGRRGRVHTSAPRTYTGPEGPVPRTPLNTINPTPTIHPAPTDVTGQPFPDIRYQRDLGDENQDIATEGLGWNVPLGDLVFDRIVVRPADRAREKHHPLGHRTEPLGYLYEDEWQLWTSVLESIR